MGNTPSNAQAANRPGAGRASHPNSPVVKSAALPDLSTPLVKGRPSRRKKSIELSDVNTSLSFTSTPQVAARSSSWRRKNSEAVADLSGDEMEIGEGTLRGAMQGKAEHVVYGPRRDDASTPLPSAGPTPRRGTSSSLLENNRPPSAISLPSTSALSVEAPMHADDTTHPSYKASPRLTSAVLLSQDRMPVIVSPSAEDFPADSPFGASGRQLSQGPPTSLTGAAASIFAPTSSSAYPATNAPQLLPPHTSPPYPPSHPPIDSVLAPRVPSSALPIAVDSIPSGTGVIPSPSPPYTPSNPAIRISPAVLLPPNLFNAPLAAIPIPLLSVPSATIAASLLAAAVDLGAGKDGVPTLIKWKNEDGQGVVDGVAKGPKEVFVTGTFAKGWKTKIELRKTDASDFSALISLPPGPHRLKFIVDKEWKASKHLPVATDADGNLINYLQVNANPSKAAATLLDWSSGSLVAPGSTSTSSGATIPPTAWGALDEDEEDKWEVDDSEWTQEIPPELVEWGEWETARDAIESGFLNAGGTGVPPNLPPPPSSSGVAPPSLPAQLEKGPLNHAAYVTQGSGDDNSILPKPDHSVINHLAASPIKGGFLSVGVTTRYKRKFVTIVYYKALASRD